jgi:2,4-dienoyl-CoA reductase-like NADH-dependent reductase (Old Yellow Enzyme family)
MVNFIFMLTHNDVTVPNAIEVFNMIKDTEVSCVGFKDKGLTFRRMESLVDLMKKEGKIIFFEVVSENKEDAMRSAKRAVALNVDYLIGGTYVEEMLQVLKDKIRYMPYIGRVVGHPCLLRGKLDEIVAEAKRVEDLGAAGINLLAFRWDGDAYKLVKSVKNVVHIPIIVAGSINSFEKIRKVIDLKVWGFTMGGAVFEKRFCSEGDLKDQITSVIKEIRRPEED